MKKLIINVLLIVSLTNISGCSTFIVRLAEPSISDEFKMYPATCVNLMCIYVGYIGGVSSLINATEIEDVGLICLSPIVILGNTIDLPISAVSDTLLLPIDMYFCNYPDKSDDTKKKQSQEELKTDKKGKIENPKMDGRCRDPRMLGSPTS